MGKITLAEFIKNKRDELGMGQEELAAKAQVSQGYLSKIESGLHPKHSGSYNDKIVRILKCCGLTMEEVFRVLDTCRRSQPK